MKTIAFSLTMPNCGSWNGRWSGENQKHLLFCKFPNGLATALDGQSWDYDFGDGWCALIDAKIVGGEESRELRKQNAGFCGYEWMVESILAFGKIERP